VERRVKKPENWHLYEVKKMSDQNKTKKQLIEELEALSK
jgi:hypothetical protein